MKDHSCHDACENPMCALQRELRYAEARTEISEQKYESLRKSVLDTEELQGRVEILSVDNFELRKESAHFREEIILLRSLLKQCWGKL